MYRRRIAACIALFLSGCATDDYFIKTEDLTNKTALTDAKVRAIVAFPPVVAEKGSLKRQVVCAEPSPDVAQAMARAIQAGLSLDLGKVTGADTANKTLGFNFGQSSAASIAQLGERLAVVQLLRDKMYRACEAYANGAMGQAAYTLILARHDKTMMSLLSNELAAGAFGRALAATNAQSSAGGVDPKTLAEQQTKVKTAADNLKTLATAEAPKKDDVSGAATKLETEVAKLLTLERSINASAGTTAQTPGTISGQGSRTGSAEVASIHQNYIDDDGIDPLVDVCIIGVERLSTSDPEAKSYLQGIASRWEKARARMADLTSQVANVKGDVDRATVELTGIDRQLAQKASPIQGPKRDALEARQAELRLKVAEGAAILDAWKDERANLEKTPQLRSSDLYLASGSPFAAFCFETVLSGDSEFMGKRLKQKRLLRGLEASEEMLTLKRLELCTLAMKADKGAMDAAARTQMLSNCAKLTEPRPRSRQDGANVATGG